MCMFETHAETGEEHPMMHEFILLTDDFSEYAIVSAFLCTAVVAVMSTDEPQKPEVIEGARHCMENLQSRMQELKRNLHHVCERYRIEQGKVDLPGR